MGEIGMASRRTLSTILGLAAIALWSTTVALSRSLAEQLGPLTSACLIYALGGALGFGYQAQAGGLSIRSLGPRYLFGCGSLFVLYMASLYLGLGLARDRIQAMEVGLMNYLWPMLTLLFSVPILQMRASAALIPGAVLATGGVFLVTAQDRLLSGPSLPGSLLRNGVPYLLGLTAAVSWALYSTLSRRWAGGTKGGAVPAFMLGTGAILGLARLLVPENTQWTGRAWLELLYMVLGSNLAYAFWERAMREGDLVLVAACSYLTPLLSTAISTLYLGVVPGARFWIGCACVVMGAAVCKLAVREKV